MSPERGTFTLLPNNKSMTLELNDNQVSLIRTALDTRLQRIDGMLNMFRNDGHKETDPLVVAYLQETQEVKEMYEILTQP